MEREENWSSGRKVEQEGKGDGGRERRKEEGWD